MSKRSRLDLLVRVRYLNPLPPPPFPPKLLSLSTDITRLGEPSYLDDLSGSTPLPMLVDSEMGMPVDLNQYERAWTGRDDRLYGDVPTQELDPEDLMLLTPLEIANRSALAGAEKIAPGQDVAWMGSSTLFTRKAGVRRKDERPTERSESVDASETAQIMAIEHTFVEQDGLDLRNLRHPDMKRKHLTAVESYDILPDVDTWDNSYIIMKYPERPTATNSADPSAEASSSRLDNALLRPMMGDDQQIMQYLVPGEHNEDRLRDRPLMDEERIRNVEELSAADGGDARLDEDFQGVYYDNVRMYEVVSQNTSRNEVLLSIVEGDESAVRYKDISMRTLVRKIRTINEHDMADPIWDRGRLWFRSPQSETEALSKAEMVMNPDWTNTRLREVRGPPDELTGQGEAINDED